MGPPVGNVRVLHVVDRYRHGGTERNIEHFVRGEIDRGRSVDIALLGDGNAPDVPGAVGVLQVPRTSRLSSPPDLARAITALRSLIASGGYDAVHSHKSRAGVVARLAVRQGLPVVLHTIHMASFGSQAYGRAASAAYVAAERACARRTDLLVTVGDDLRRLYLAAGIGHPDQYAVVRSPVDLDGYAALRSWAAERREVVRRFLEVGDRRLLISVGILERRKRPALILEELVPLLRSGHAVLAYLGDGPEEERLRSLAAARGVSQAVRLLGYVRDPRPFFGAADVLVQASRAEGVPQVVLQALAAGLPVVATEVEGVREVPGAPITVVARTGKDIAAAVTAAAGQPVSLDALAPWRPESVEAQQARLHDLVDGLIEVRRGNTIGRLSASASSA